MKKFLFLAALSAVLTASAEDNYIYFMFGVDDNAKVDETAITSLGYENVYAKIKVEGGDYLSLYASPESANTYGQAFKFEPGESMTTFAQLASSLSGNSFIVELYNNQDATAKDSWIGQATLAWNANSATTGGMGVATPSYATGFTAAPEPTSGMLLLLGVAGLALRRKNKKA